jgi:hypothetical protein
MKHGQGTLTFVNGYKIEGTWAEDELTGSSKVTDPEGNQFTVNWLGNKLIQDNSSLV